MLINITKERGCNWIGHVIINNGYLIRIIEGPANGKIPSRKLRLKYMTQIIDNTKKNKY